MDKIPSINEITGSLLSTKPSSEAYREGWDNIFGKKEPKNQDILDSNELNSQLDIEDKVLKVIVEDIYQSIKDLEI